MTHKTGYNHLFKTLFFLGATYLLPSAVLAAGSCNNYTPDTNGSSVVCSDIGTTSVGVISSQGSTTVGNGVSVTVNSGTSLVINGSTIGLGSGANVQNNGNLNTSQFYYGYGISSGANGRSQSGDSTLINRGTIYTGGIAASGMYVSATNAGSRANIIENSASGLITTAGANAAGIRLISGATSSSVVNSIVNNGVINTTGSGAHGIQVSGVGAVAIENSGSLANISTTGPNSFGIYNAGNIISLANAQGGSAPLTYSGVLPTNYNVIVTNTSNYGKLDVAGGSVTGVMNFNIHNTSTLTYDHTYATILNGIKINNLGNSYGTFTSGGNTYQWALVHRVGGPANQTDLVIQPIPQSSAPPSLSEVKAALLAESYILAPINYDTQMSVSALGNTLQSLFATQSAGLVNGMTYDCPLFGNNNVCVSAGGRFTNVSGFPYNNTSALLIGAYRFSSNLRFGAYLDQNLSQSTPGGIAQLNNASPMVGVFGVWTQNVDGTGLEAKIAAGYANKQATLTRPAIGVSEAGTGSTGLNTQGVLGVLKYGFGVGKSSIFSPYAGMRYVVGGMGGYMEAQSSTVSSPLTYNAINNYTTTALAGLTGAYKLNEKTNIFASAGAEKDVNANVGNLTTGGNGEFNIAMNNNFRTVRPTASLGIYYDLSNRERLGMNAIYRQESYQAITSSTILATYTVGI